MKKVAILIYSALAYLIFLAVFLYLIGFLGNLFVPKGIDGGVPSSVANALLINSGLILLFGVPHSVMARRPFKQWLTRTVPKAAERSTYVLVSSLLLGLTMWQWRPLPAVIWQAEGVAAQLLWLLFGIGWAILLLSTYLINHFELFGLQQSLFNLINRAEKRAQFKTPFLYKWVRHPMMTGLLIGIWATPTMTVGHFFFALGMTIYMMVGLHYEERDLTAEFGQQYAAYQEQVPMLLPLPQGGKESAVEKRA